MGTKSQRFQYQGWGCRGLKGDDGSRDDITEEGDKKDVCPCPSAWPECICELIVMYKVPERNSSAKVKIRHATINVRISEEEVTPALGSTSGLCSLMHFHPCKK